MRVFITLCILVTILTACSPYNDVEINVEIPPYKTIFELVNHTSERLYETYGTKNWDVGRVRMEVDENHQGKIEIVYAKNDDYPPYAIAAYIDAENNILEGFDYLGKDSKSDPGIVNIHKWNVDSFQALDIVINHLTMETDDHEFNQFRIWTNNVRDHWVVRVINENYYYFYEIDPYNGSILSHGKNDIPKHNSD